MLRLSSTLGVTAKTIHTHKLSVHTPTQTYGYSQLWYVYTCTIIIAQMYVECVQSIIPPRYFEHLSAVFHLCFVCVTQAGNDDIGWVGQCVCMVVCRRK